MTIGPTFAAEIAAAGLAGLPFSWSTSGIAYDDALSEADRARVEAVLAAHDPEAPVPAPDVPATISDRQFAQALAEAGIVPRAEALAFIQRGKLPAALKSVIDAMPDEAERLTVEMYVSGETTLGRSHPSILALARALGWSFPQTDDLWRRAAAL